MLVTQDAPAVAGPREDLVRIRARCGAGDLLGPLAQQIGAHLQFLTDALQREAGGESLAHHAHALDFEFRRGAVFDKAIASSRDTSLR